MAICQWVRPAADENTIPWLLAKTPPLHLPRVPAPPRCRGWVGNFMPYMEKCEQKKKGVSRVIGIVLTSLCRFGS